MLFDSTERKFSTVRIILLIMGIAGLSFCEDLVCKPNIDQSMIDIA